MFTSTLPDLHGRVIVSLECRGEVVARVAAGHGDADEPAVLDAVYEQRRVTRSGERKDIGARDVRARPDASRLSGLRRECHAVVDLANRRDDRALVVALVQRRVGIDAKRGAGDTQS